MNKQKTYVLIIAEKGGSRIVRLGFKIVFSNEDPKPAGANMLAAEETSGVSQCCESLYSVSQNDIIQIKAHQYNPL